MSIDRTISAAWREPFICTGELTIAGERAIVYRAADRGELVRVVRGVYLPRAEWERLTTVEARHLAKIRAIALTHDGAVFSHLSAGVLWGLPIAGAPLVLPHLTADRADGGRSATGFIRHCTGIPDGVVTIDGIRVTNLAQTVVDIAALTRMSTGVGVADHALRPSRDGEEGVAAARVGRAELLELGEVIPGSSGAARCRRAIEFADGRSGSVGESISRVAIHQIGFPAPELQVEFTDHDGLIGIVDFYWEDHQEIGEFDGHGKYLREELRRGEDAGEAVVREKRREDRLRATKRGVTRWGWDVARSLSAMRAHLIRAGLRAR